MKINKKLHTYQNGNVAVTLYEDGTQVREWEDNPIYSFPCHADVKITQYCDLDAVCVFCHEMSNKEGKHGDLELLEKVWSEQPAGTEMAIGGGNPLAHPDIYRFLYNITRKGIIPNLTINSLHLKRFSKLINQLQEDKCFYGMGISYRGKQYLKNLPTDISYKNAVFHMILGLNDLDDCKAVIEWCKENRVKPKLLLLGYKQFGNGIGHYSEELQQKIDAWQEHLTELLETQGLTVSFDNLAIAQLGLQKFMSEKDWEQFYLGDDGTASLYVDAIKQEFAKTSTSTKRYPLSMVKNTKEMMAIIHEEIKL